MSLCDWHVIDALHFVSCSWESLVILSTHAQIPPSHQSRESAVFFISVGRKEKYGWLARLPLHKENALVNQVNPLGIAHTFATRVT